VDALIALQGPEGQGCWAEQYGPDMRPATARTHEPAGYVVRESRDIIGLLQAFYLRTGDPRYLTPVPRCLDWFDRINREAMAERYPTPRYWEPGTNRPRLRGAHGRVHARGLRRLRVGHRPVEDALRRPARARATASRSWTWPPCARSTRPSRR
jgi:hypothetical protein